MAIGLASNLSPMYIAEVAPAHLRGRLVAINQLTIVIGILPAQIVNWLIARPVPDGADGGVHPRSPGTASSAGGGCSRPWPSRRCSSSSGAVLVPESPRWLVKNGRPGPGAARPGPDRRRRPTPRPRWPTSRARCPGEEIQQRPLPATCSSRGCARSCSSASSWPSSSSGAASTSSSTTPRRSSAQAGYGVSSILFNIVITGAVNLVFTLVAIRTVDRFGRRALMLVGCAGHRRLPLADRPGLSASASRARSSSSRSWRPSACYALVARAR